MNKAIKPLRPRKTSVVLLVLLVTTICVMGLPVHAKSAESKTFTAASSHTSLAALLKKLAVEDVKANGQAGPVDMRAFGKVSAAGATWGSDDSSQSLVVFETEDAEHARILASKYLTDLLSYSTAKFGSSDSKTGGAVLEIPDAGFWNIGIDGKNVVVLSAPNQKSLTVVSKKLGADIWNTPQLATYPKYLDCFDNSALGMWWQPSTKPQEILDFAKTNPAIINIHTYHGLNSSYAPNVYDFTAADNIIAQARLIGKPYRFMIWGGLPSWWARSVGDFKPHAEMAVKSAHPSRDLGGADGYTKTQIPSPTARGLELDSMLQVMNRYKDNDDLVAWMEPHAEFYLSDPRFVPPNAEQRFVEYLQSVKGYRSLEKANQAFGINAKDWKSFPYPEMSYFFGRRGKYIDLDEKQWKWCPGITKADGIGKGMPGTSFDDSGWAEDKRASRRLLNQLRAQGNTAPLWYRFTEKVPAAFLEDDAKIYLHVMPYTQKEGRDLDVWINGQTATGKTMDPHTYKNQHTQFDVTGLLKAGENNFAIYSHGGRISYRVFLSKTPGKSFPFAEQQLNQFWMDWNDYLIWEKLETLKLYLAAMRSVDPVRPIKVMTPHMFQSDAMDLFERFGAYPQLTGEGTWYRPMHYKGYSRLRGLPGSSEGGSPAPDARHIRQKFAYIFWENQDAHDYVFDIQQDFWSHPDVVEWWKQHNPLLKTLGKIDFPKPTLAVLRDTQQEERFLNSDVWNWDVSRGPLPSAGISPVLVDGPDLDKGLADKIPVIFDCATSVMTPERVKAIRHYIENGGTFVAQFNTGRHTPLDKDSWPLAKAFGLKVQDYRTNQENLDKWPTAKITFTEEQEIMPMLKGKTVEGCGVSINYEGDEKTEAVTFQGSRPVVKAVAKWQDGGMAVCEVSYGKGRLLWFGTPFYARLKGQNEKWMNDAGRQGLFEDLLHGLGVELETKSSDPRVWIERRESKNGLYDVYISAGMNMLDKKWKETDEIITNLTLRNAHGSMVFDMTKETPEIVPAAGEGKGLLMLRDQGFNPYQVRQFAVVRKNPGLHGPLHWLDVQWNYWRALENPDTKILADVDKIVAGQAKLLGQDGRSLNDDWKVRVYSGEKPADDGWTGKEYDAAAWMPGKLGTWLVNGWTRATAAQYRKTVNIPKEWIAEDRRIFLGFKSGFYALGIVGSGQMWVNGKTLGAKLQNPMIVDITDAAAGGTIDLAMQVLGDPMRGGPGGVLYLWSLPKPLKTIDLTGEWIRATSWNERNGTLKLPGVTEKVFGLSRTFELPADWVGKAVRLVVEQDERGQSVGAVIVNQTGYFREAPSSLAGYGIRVDQWFQKGKNEIDLYCPRHSSYQDYYKRGIPSMRGEIKSVRLELYN